MPNGFKSKRSILWLGGVAALIFGLLLAAVILPASERTRGTDGPNVQVPKMENVPPDQAPKMKLDVEKKQ